MYGQKTAKTSKLVLATSASSSVCLNSVQSKEAVPLRSSDVDRIPAMSSREDLKHFVASEITKAGTAIEAGFDLFLESR